MSADSPMDQGSACGAGSETGRATAADLARLHGLLARILTARLLEGDVSATELNVARQFLKDNGVDCAEPPSADPLALLAQLPRFDDEPDM